MVRARCLLDIRVFRLMHQVGDPFYLSGHLQNLTATIGPAYRTGMVGQNRAVALGARLDLFWFQLQVRAALVALGTGMFLGR